MSTGQTIHTLKDHTGRVNVVALTSDGLRAVSGSRGGRLRLWDLGTGQTIHTLEGHTDQVNAVAVTLDSSPTRLGLLGPNAAALGP